MMQRVSLQYDIREPGAREACLAAWDAAVPVGQPGDIPGDARERENAARCRAIIEKSKQANAGRRTALCEADAEWIAAEWLAAYQRMLTQRAKVIAGDTSPNTIGLMLLDAQEMGRLEKDLYWRPGVDPQTLKGRESLSVSGRKQVKSGQDGNAMKGQKSFAAVHGAEAQARAHEIATARPSLSWAAIRSIIATEYSTSAETVKKALTNPKKGG